MLYVIIRKPELKASSNKYSKCLLMDGAPLFQDEDEAIKVAQDIANLDGVTRIVAEISTVVIPQRHAKTVRTPNVTATELSEL